MKRTSRVLRRRKHSRRIRYTLGFFLIFVFFVMTRTFIHQSIKTFVKTNVLDHSKFYSFRLPGPRAKHLFTIKSIPSPKGVAFRPDGEEIWVTSLLNKKRGVATFHSSTGEKITDINLKNGGGVEVIFSPSFDRAYVSQMESCKIYEIDAGKKQILRIFDTESSWTKVLALSKEGNTLFAANWSGNDVSEFDLKEGKLRRRIPTVTTPRGLYLTQDGRTLYVAGYEKGEIQKINLENSTKKILHKSGGAMRHIIGDEEKRILYVSDMGKNVIMTVDLITDEVKQFAKTNWNPNTIALSPDRKILFVSNRGKNASATNYSIPGPELGTILLFDTETGETIDTIVGGNQPTALAVSPDGTRLAFSNFLDATVEVFALE